MDDTEDETEEYCSNACMKHMESAVKSEFTTLSIKRDLKLDIEKIQLDVKYKIKGNITYSDLVECLIKIANIHGNPADNIAKIFMAK